MTVTRQVNAANFRNANLALDRHVPQVHDVPMEHDAPLTADEAGDILGVSGRTVIRRAEAGELAYIRKLPGPNGDWLFDRAVILRYAAELAEREQAEAATA